MLLLICVNSDVASCRVLNDSIGRSGRKSTFSVGRHGHSSHMPAVLSPM